MSKKKTHRRYRMAIKAQYLIGWLISLIIFVVLILLLLRVIPHRGWAICYAGFGFAGLLYALMWSEGVTRDTIHPDLCPLVIPAVAIGVPLIPFFFALFMVSLPFLGLYTLVMSDRRGWLVEAGFLEPAPLPRNVNDDYFEQD